MIWHRIHYLMCDVLLLVGFSTELLWLVRDLNEFELQGEDQSIPPYTS